MLEQYEQIRRKLFGGYRQNSFLQLLQDRTALHSPMQGTPEEFAQILYELSDGSLNTKNSKVTYLVIGKTKRNTLLFPDGSRFTVIRTKGGVEQTLIVVAPYRPAPEDLVIRQELPLSRLVSDGVRIQDAYTSVAGAYRENARAVRQEKEAEERRIERESTLAMVLHRIEKAKSGDTVMIRGIQNIDALVKLRFAPGLVNNPDNWIDAEDFPGLYYRHSISRTAMILTGRERFRPIEELSRLELYFQVNRSDDDAPSFERMARKFRTTKQDGTTYSLQELHQDLITLVKYPEELKGRTVEDLGLIAVEVEQVIDRRQELDKGILPYEAVFGRDTNAIIEYVLRNRIPAGEFRKALDYFEYTGMIDQQYRTELDRQLRAASPLAPAAVPISNDMLRDRRVKEIVSAVLKNLSREQLTAKTITLALAPYVTELGFGKLVRIRDRILQLKEQVHDHDGYGSAC